MKISPVLLLCIHILLLVGVTAAGILLELDDLRRTPGPVPLPAPKISTITFAGDIMAHDVNYHTPSYREIYREVAPLLQTDLLSFANLEFPVDPSKPYSNYPRFNNHPEYIQAAVEAGFDVFSAANNHAADQGPDSIHSTRRVLENLAVERDISWSGLREHHDDPLFPVSIEAGGMRIGFLAITFFLNVKEDGGLVYRVDFNSVARREAFLRYLRSVTPSYDLFILSVHGGVEYRQLPLPGKYGYFVQLIETGVDILWGHHPHVLQPYQLLSLPEGRKAVIINSAGNFISGQTWHMQPDDPLGEESPRGESALYRVHLVHTPEGGILICGVEAVPIVNYRDRGHGMIVRLHTGLASDGLIEGKWREFYNHRTGALAERLRPFDFHNIVVY
jgi:Bacterial capsule synthesis protein PGA_cap